MTSFRLSCRHYMGLRRLLNGEGHFATRGLGQRLDNIGAAYRNRQINALRSRADDRAALLALAELAERVAGALQLSSERGVQAWDNILPVPEVTERAQWLRSVARNVAELRRAHLVQASEDGDDARFQGDLLELADGISLLDRDANRHPGMTLAPGSAASPSSEWTGALGPALLLVADACRRARTFWKAERGPESNSAMRLLAEDLYDAVLEARGTPLKLALHDQTRSYTGRPQNDDTSFLLAFTEWAIGTVPEHVRDARPRWFVATAIFDAYKNVSTESCARRPA